MTEDEVVEMARKYRPDWSTGQAQAVVRKILEKGWSREALYLGLRAKFKCEYCQLPLLDSPDGYKLWERDHIDPDGPDEPGNLALACLPCNCKFKNKWWRPSKGSSQPREMLVAEVSQYVKRRRCETMEEIEAVREILES